MGRRLLSCAILASGTPVVTALSASPLMPAVPAHGVTISDVPASEATVAAAYWTPDRMAGATPAGPRAAPVGARAKAVPRSGAVAPAGPGAVRSAGSPAVGVLFFTTKHRRDHFCTASVVSSGRRNLIITAAHCLYTYGRDRQHTNLAFVPGYARGRAPYGVFTAKRFYVPYGWARRGDAGLDVGFVTLRPLHGRDVAEVTGANGLVTKVRPPRRVRVIGYPSVAHVPADRPISCDATARRASRRQLTFSCPGFYGGTSGSPWLWRYDGKRRLGSVVGVIGGYHAGGLSPGRSYSALFGDDVAMLRRQAEALG